MHVAHIISKKEANDENRRFKESSKLIIPRLIFKKEEFGYFAG